jgi:drug/metabolite transporter (DMT)-like permease
MGFFLAGVARLDAGVASVLSTIEPVVSIAVGVIALNEQLTPVRTMGALAVLLGVSLLAQFSRASTK